MREERHFEPEHLPPQITIQNAFNSLRVPNHILLTLFDYSSLPCSRAMWALDPMLRGPGASARVILVHNQKQNGSAMFSDTQAVKSISNLNLGPQSVFEMRLTACHYSKQK